MLNWQTTIDSPLNSLAALAVQLQALVTTVVNHPVRTIVMVVLGLVLLQIIADFIKRLVQASLAFMLKLPLTLSQWLWQRITPSAAKAKTLDQLIERLDTLREEQDQVVTEIKALLSQAKRRPAEAVHPAKSPAVPLETSLEKAPETVKPTAAQSPSKK